MAYARDGLPGGVPRSAYLLGGLVSFWMVGFCVLLAPAARGADRAPGWLDELASSELPTYEAKVPAVVLVNEESVTLEAGGKATRTLRYAVRVLNQEGAREAQQAVVYYTDTGKVKDLKGWLISPGGDVKELGKGNTAIGSVGSGLFEQVKYQMIDATSQADPGAVFGFESTVEEKSVFTQFTFDFQSGLPALRSAFTLNLPAGWRAEGKLMRGLTVEPMEANVSAGAGGATYNWTLRRLDPFAREPAAPRASTLTPSLLVSTFPPADSAAEGVSGHFETWGDVSRWVAQFVDPAAQVTPPIESRAAEVGAGAASDWEKIRLLAEEAQSIRYESIQLNLSRGGGYTPHAAASVLANGYGDCKDKATYLRTLLKTIGVESYPVTIYSGDPRRTRQEWPSPMQFNHAILAIRLPDTLTGVMAAPALFEFPGLGRMILFDPTDDTVPFGFLPDHEQDANALLLAGAQGDMFRTPATSPEVNRIERLVNGQVDGNGALIARVTQTATGQEAFDERYYWREQTQPEYLRFFERRLSRSQRGVKIREIVPAEDASGSRFDIELDFEVAAYARIMQGRLMMLQPAVMSFDGLPDLTNPKRTQPLLVYPASFHDRVELALPAGFVVDEMPGPVEISSGFGEFKVRYESQEGRLIMEREIELRSAWVPVEEFDPAREFFGAIGGSELAPVVLVRP